MVSVFNEMQQVLINLNIVAQTGLEYDAVLNRQPHEEYGNFTKMGIFFRHQFEMVTVPG